MVGPILHAPPPRYSRNVRLNIALSAVLAAISIGCADAGPTLNFAEDMPDDLRQLADATWVDFLEVNPARLDCIEPVTLEAAWELDNRAEYRPASRTLAVRVPGTPATLRSELIHEFAHHLEFTCSDQTELRAAFLHAQGFPPETEWFGGATWETTPSEQYAEATVEVVAGRRAHTGRILLTPEAVEVVRQWGEGS